MFPENFFRIIAFSSIIGTSAVPATAQESEVLKETMIARWNVVKVQTPNDGLSCQAYKCNTRVCDVDTAEATFRLWGSEKRKSVTPMIGSQTAKSGVRGATATVADQSFPLSQAKGSRGKLFIAKRPDDDAKIMRLLALNPRGTITFTSGKGGARFQLKGIGRVISFFERECSIPKP